MELTMLMLGLNRPLSGHGIEVSHEDICGSRLC